MDFAVNGSPREVSEAIERYARAQGNVTALVVPWESTTTTLNMAVTLVKSDGWAIEHTNLGTISLTAESDGTRVGIVAADPDREDRARLVAVFERFARDIEQRLGDPAATDSRQGRS
jgi:hypothetical protein